MRRLIWAIVGGGVAVFAGVTAMDDDTTRNDDGVIVDGGGLGAFKVRVGDCVQWPDEREVMSIEGVPCDVPHDAQAYVTFDLPDGPYPGEAAVDSDWFDGCEARWKDGVGTEWETDPVYDVAGFTPTPEGW